MPKNVQFCSRRSVSVFSLSPCLLVPLSPCLRPPPRPASGLKWLKMALDLTKTCFIATSHILAKSCPRFLRRIALLPDSQARPFDELRATFLGTGIALSLVIGHLSFVTGLRSNGSRSEILPKPPVTRPRREASHLLRTAGTSGANRDDLVAHLRSHASPRNE
jgi:hypothetical protein